MQKLIDKETEHLQKKLLSSKEYKQLEYKIESPFPYIKQRMHEMNISNKQAAVKLSVSESTISKMLKGERISRDGIIKLCILLELNLEEVNQILKYLSHQVLYAKDPRDAIIIHGISFNKTIDEINQTLSQNNIIQI